MEVVDEGTDETRLAKSWPFLKLGNRATDGGSLYCSMSTIKVLLILCYFNNVSFFIIKSFMRIVHIERYWKVPTLEIIQNMNGVTITFCHGHTHK